MIYSASGDRYAKMEYRPSGKSGLKLPLVSLGLWHSFGHCDNYDNMVEMCLTAFDNGITHLDLANNYGPPHGAAEENFARIINGPLKPHRDELVISTKAGYQMWDGPYGDWGSRKYILASLDQSLERMKLDYVDIFYHHRMDPDTPLEESMSALDTAVKSGRALYAGISNYDRQTTKRAMEILKGLNCPFIINQIRYSIFDRHIEQDDLKSFARENGLGLIAFSPLAQGMLSDRYLQAVPDGSRASKAAEMKARGALSTADLTEERRHQLLKLNEIAKERGQTLAQMALSWVLRDGDVTSVLIGASKPSQILENIEIVGRTAFSESERTAIDRVSPA